MPHGKPSKKAAQWSSIGPDRRHKMRLRIIERDGTACFHCGCATRIPDGSEDPAQMTIDHWPIPKRDLPRRSWLDPSTAVLACLGCNRRLDHQSQTREVMA